MICEPSKLQIKAGQKGRVELLLTFHGKPAHAATPHVGVNPLHAAAKALTVLETLPLPHDDVLGQALLVPTDIVSDPYPSISMIPGAVTIRFDRRTVSGERLEDVLAQIRGHLAGHGLSDFTLAVSEGRVETYTGQHATPPRWLPGWRCDGDTALLAARAAVSASGRSRWWVPGRSAPTARNPPDGAVFRRSAWGRATKRTPTRSMSRLRWSSWKAPAISTGTWCSPCAVERPAASGPQWKFRLCVLSPPSRSDISTSRCAIRWRTPSTFCQAP